MISAWLSPSATKDDLLKELTEEMYRCHGEGIVPVIVIDEAQMIPGREVFDEIRLLTNFQLDDTNLLSVILMGQPELRERLAEPVYEPLRQRIGIQYHLNSADPGRDAGLYRFPAYCRRGKTRTVSARCSSQDI